MPYTNGCKATVSSLGTPPQATTITMSTMASSTKPPAPARASSPSQSQASPPSLGGVFAYFKGVREEWGKITWPTGLQLFAQLVVVLVMVTLTTLLVWGIDSLLAWLIAWVVPARAGL